MRSLIAILTFYGLTLAVILGGWVLAAYRHPETATAPPIAPARPPAGFCDVTFTCDACGPVVVTIPAPHGITTAWQVASNPGLLRLLDTEATVRHDLDRHLAHLGADHG